MRTRFTKRALTIESLQQRLLLTANQAEFFGGQGTVLEGTVPDQRDVMRTSINRPTLTETVTLNSSPMLEFLSGEVKSDDACDVSGDGQVTPRDLLLLMNDVHNHGFRQLDGEGEEANSRVDVSGDGYLSPLDLLLVINALNEERTLELQQSQVPASNGNPDHLLTANSEMSPDLWGLSPLQDGADLPTDAAGVPKYSLLQTHSLSQSSASTHTDIQFTAASRAVFNPPLAMESLSSDEDAYGTDDFWARSVDNVFEHGDLTNALLGAI